MAVFLKAGLTDAKRQGGRFPGRRAAALAAAAMLFLSGMAGQAAAVNGAFPASSAAPPLFGLFGKKKSKADEFDPEKYIVRGAVPGRSVPGTEEEAPGTLSERCDEAVIDYSNASDGYVMINYTGKTDAKIKAQIESGGVIYTYTLTPSVWASFPLSEGNGMYRASVFRDIGNSRYAQILSVNFPVQMNDEFGPFLRTNQYVNYAAAPNASATAANLVSESGDTLETVRNVYKFVVAWLKYDYDLAENVQSGYLPDLDRALETRTGICFDYASLMTGMLRSTGIPCKLVVGYAGTLYHAWISVWVNGTGWVDNVVFFNGSDWELMDPTFASGGYSQSEAAYSAKYFY